MKCPGWATCGMVAFAVGVGLASCKREAEKAPSINRPPRVVSTTTAPSDAELLEQRKARLVPIPDLGQGVNAKQPDGTVWIRYPSGIKVHLIWPTDKRKPRWGQTVAIQYVGTLAESGKVFDRSEPGKPFTFELGSKDLTLGFNMAMRDATLDSKRRIYIPANLAYGEQGNPKLGIGPNQALIYEVEVLGIEGDGIDMPIVTTGPGVVPSTATTQDMMMGPALPATAPAK